MTSGVSSALAQDDFSTSEKALDVGGQRLREKAP